MTEIITYDVYIDELNEELGVDKISLVRRPAVLTDFIYMSDELSDLYKQVRLSDDKQIITGPALITDLEIIRKDEDGEPYYIKYSADQIEKISQQFFKLKSTKDINKDHKDNKAEGSYIYESWIVGENDKSKELGFDLPVGSWMITLKVEDAELWDQIKSGKYKGFSIEGLFKFKRVSKLVKQEEDYLTLEGDAVNLFIDEATKRGIKEEDLMKLASADLIDGFTDTELKMWYGLTAEPKNFYVYAGDLADNSRDFCRQMLGINKLYSFEDLQAITNVVVNEGFGPKGTSTYDVWLYKGGANCKHHWDKYFISNQGGKYTKVYGGRVAGRPGTNTYDMPKRGFLERVDLNSGELLDESIKKEKINMISVIVKDGQTFYTDAEAMAIGVGVYTLDGETKAPVVEGEYELEDGTIVVIGKESEIVEIRELETEVEAGEKPAEEKPTEETKMEVDPILMEQFDVIKGMLEALNAKIDAIGGDVSAKVEQMEVKLEKEILEKEIEETETIDKKVEMNATGKRRLLNYELITKYNKKF